MAKRYTLRRKTAPTLLVDYGGKPPGKPHTDGSHLGKQYRDLDNEKPSQVIEDIDLLTGERSH